MILSQKLYHIYQTYCLKERSIKLQFFGYKIML